ncbi:MAG: mechanosensitive ion channel family protein [Nitrospirota bacterium]
MFQTKALLKDLDKIIWGRGSGPMVIRITLLMIIGFLAARFIRLFLTRLERALLSKNGSSDPIINKRMSTLFGMFRAVCRLSIWVTVLIFCLDQMGVNIGPILAGAGIVGLVLGLGAQNLIRDWIAGFFIIVEGQIHLGDTAVINSVEGLVEGITFRTITLRDTSAVVHYFSNGSIASLANRTCGWSAYVVEVAISYKEDIGKVIEQMQLVADAMRAETIYQNSFLETVGPLSQSSSFHAIEIFGVETFGDSGVTILSRIKTKPGAQWAIGREYRRRLKNQCDTMGVTLMAPHRDTLVKLKQISS